MRRIAFKLTALLALPLTLAGCDMLGMEPASAVAARKEAEGKAVGGACRHAGRAIEDCYTLNKKADKAAVFNGWREMNDYMRENKIETVAPQIPTPALLAAKQAVQPADAESEAGAEGSEPPAKSGKSGSGKH
jgi:hypothetical protein